MVYIMSFRAPEGMQLLELRCCAPGMETDQGTAGQQRIWRVRVVMCRSINFTLHYRASGMAGIVHLGLRTYFVVSPARPVV